MAADMSSASILSDPAILWSACIQGDKGLLARKTAVKRQALKGKLEKKC
jgi:hypothetical protein